MVRNRIRDSFPVLKNNTCFPGEEGITIPAPEKKLLIDKYSRFAGQLPVLPTGKQEAIPVFSIVKLPFSLV